MTKQILTRTIDFQTTERFLAPNGEIFERQTYQCRDHNTTVQWVAPGNGRRRNVNPVSDEHFQLEDAFNEMKQAELSDD